MILALLKVVAVCVALVVLLGLVSGLGRRYQWHGEWQRKLLHMGLGFCAMTFPWVFDRSWQVPAVSMVAMGVMLLIRKIPRLRSGLGSGIHGVKRGSVGELLFAAAVVLLFWQAHDQPVLYLVPLVILTLSDSLAALVGTHFGKRVFKVVDGHKSWEGTFAFAVFSFVLSLVLLTLMTDLPLTNLLIIALTLALLSALIEAVSWQGLDNLLVPLATYLLLSELIPAGERFLLTQLFALLAVILTGVVAGPKSKLNTHALMTAALALYFFGVSGGLIWVFPPLFLFFFHIALAKINRHERKFTVEAVIGVAGTGLLWLFAARATQLGHAYVFYALAFAIHLQIMVLLRLKELRNKVAEPIVVLMVCAVTGSPLFLSALLYYGTTREILILVGAAFFIALAGGLTVRVSSDIFSTERWFKQACLAGLGSALLILPYSLIGVFS